MISGILALYAGIIIEYERKWAGEEEERRWAEWEKYEGMRRDMGHVKQVEKIVRPKTRQPKFTRRKHRH